MKKKIFALVLGLLAAFSLVGCGKVLESSGRDFYAVGAFNGWGDAVGVEGHKMKAISLNDARVASIKKNLKGVKSLYLLEVAFPASDAGWNVSYKIDGKEESWNGNLAIKVVTTVKGEAVPEFWAQNKESGTVKNLTPDTLYIPKYQETATDGEGTWADNPVVTCGSGTRYVVFAELETKAEGDPLFAMGIVVPSTIDVALVTDVGNIDDKSFNEGAYRGVIKYCSEKGLTYAYWRPARDETEARKTSIEAAIATGAKIIVCPGYLFEEAVYDLQVKYPEVAFLILDGEPHDADYNYETKANVHCILYKEEQAGYLAGFAAVKEGYTKLGFIGGMSVPAVVRYGYGFIQGADAAAQELGVDVTMQYDYAGSFGPSDGLATKMAAWYEAGTEVIFSCGGAIYLSVVSAVGDTDKKVIGVDVDQSAESEAIITSAEKKLVESTYLALDSFFANKGHWDEAHAGKTATLGAAEDCVGLPTSESSWRMTKFTVAEYEALFAKLKNGTIVVNNSSDVEKKPATVKVTIE